MAGHKEQKTVPGQVRRLGIYIQKRKCDKRRERRSGAFEGGPGFFVWAEREPWRAGCADQQEKAARVLESVSRQTECSPTLILISLISLVWGSVLIQAGKYEPYFLCQERVGKKKKNKTASSCVSLTSAGSETAERGVSEHGPLFLSHWEKIPTRSSFSCLRETSLQGSTKYFIFIKKKQPNCLHK